MKINELLEYKKSRRAPKFNIKPRTGHAPTQTGAGAHRDKKKELKHGQVKHKNKDVDESRGHKIIATKLANMDRMKNVQIPTPAERKAQMDKQQEKKVKEGMPGWDREFTVGDYTYYTYDEREEDNRKTFHTVQNSEGKNFDIDWTPYGKLSPQDLKIWIKLGMPDRRSLNSIGPLHHEDLVKHAQMKGIANLDPELAKAK